jgi:hypothetical protein
MRALATTPVGEFTGDSAFRTDPVTSITSAPLVAGDRTNDLFFAVGGPQIANLSTTRWRPPLHRADAAVEEHQRSCALASSRNSLTLGWLAPC